MIAQLHFPNTLSPSSLDQFLADGWFRSCNYLHKFKLLSLDNELNSVVNIRLNLEGYSPKKSMRKIANKIESNFDIVIQPAIIDSDRELLYYQHTHRFKGYIFDSLDQILFDEEEKSLFDTHEIAIYDNGRLIAVSYFDIGEDSIASIIGLFDHEYDKYSLGTYTMVAEALYGLTYGLKYYYPGYILSADRSFDYKLRIGNMDYLDVDGQWKPLTTIDYKCFPDQLLSRKLNELKQMLDSHEIAFEEIHYPYFGLGYMSPLSFEFVNSPLFLKTNINGIYSQIITYNIDKNRYEVSLVSELPQDHIILTQVRKGNEEQIIYCYEESLIKSKEVVAVIEHMYDAKLIKAY